MFMIPEQFSAAAKSHLESQLKLISTLTSSALDGAEKIITLNINTGKATVEKSSESVKQLLAVKDARELFALGATQSQPNIENLMAYGRRLFSIASGTQSELLQSAKVQPAPAAYVAPKAAARPLAAETAAPAPVAKLADEPVAMPKQVAAAKPEVKHVVATKPEVKQVVVAKPEVKQVVVAKPEVKQVVVAKPEVKQVIATKPVLPAAAKLATEVKPVAKAVSTLATAPVAAKPVAAPIAAAPAKPAAPTVVASVAAPAATAPAAAKPAVALPKQLDMLAVKTEAKK